MSNKAGLSNMEYLIMKLLMEAGSGERYGLELVEKSDKKLKRGTVYVLLGRLEEKGYVESRIEASVERQSTIPRRMYKTTGVGRRVFHACTSIAELGNLNGAFA